MYDDVFSVNTPGQAIKLMTAVHEMVRKGEARSVAAALQQLKKTRKTVDRFKNLYYLHKQDPRLMDDVSINGPHTLRPYPPRAIYHRQSQHH